MVRSLLILRPIAYELVKCSVCSGFFRRIVALSYEAADCDRATFKCVVATHSIPLLHHQSVSTRFGPNYLMEMASSAALCDKFVSLRLCNCCWTVRGCPLPASVRAPSATSVPAPAFPPHPPCCCGGSQGSPPALSCNVSAGLCGDCGGGLVKGRLSCRITALPVGVRTSPWRVSDRPPERDNLTSSTFTSSL